jgi:hypothetical protein
MTSPLLLLPALLGADGDFEEESEEEDEGELE